MPERCQTILLFGAPGVGKGTQGAMLGAIPGFFHMSMGDVFRTIDPDSELGRTCRAFSARGELVPDDVTIRMWHDYIDRQISSGNFRPTRDLLVLDGIPRSVVQAHLLEEYLDVLAIVHLVTADERAMIERLRKRAQKENRTDDAREDVIRRRLEVYREQTWPVLQAYPPLVIHEVEAVGRPAAVLHEVLSVVAPIEEARVKVPLGG